jgi:hypothetical protein
MDILERDIFACHNINEDELPFKHLLSVYFNLTDIIRRVPDSVREERLHRVPIF